MDSINILDAILILYKTIYSFANKIKIKFKEKKFFVFRLTFTKVLLSR